MRGPGRGNGSEPGAAAPPLRLVALALAGGIVPIVALALFLAPPEPSPDNALLLAVLSAVSLGSIAVGVVLAVGATGGEPRARRPGRILVSLALREAGGLVGAIPAFAGAGRAIPIALAALAVVSILALLPPAEDRD